MERKYDICHSEGCSNETSRPYKVWHSKANKYRWNHTRFCGVCRRLKRDYKITRAERDLMLKSQGNKCKICSKSIQFAEFVQKGQNRENDANIDHCHTTGKIRGILCDKCNKGLGQFYDNPYFLRLAAKYLEKLK